MIETLEETAVKNYPTIHEQYQYDAFISGAKWQMDNQDNFAVGFAEWSVARAFGYDTFTINRDELNIYKKYIDTLNDN